MKKMKNLFMFLAICVVFVACNNAKEETGYTVKGTIEGLSNETLIVKKSYKDENGKEVALKDGTFEFSGEKVNEPIMLFIDVKDKHLSFIFYVDNGEITFKGEVLERDYNGRKISHISTLEVKGCEVNDHEKFLNEAMEEIYGDFSAIRELPEKERDEILAKRKEEVEKMQMDFIKDHPKAYYSAKLIRGMIHGEDAETCRKYLNMLDPSMDNSIIREIRKYVTTHEKTDVKIQDVIKAKNVAYKVDNSFKAEDYKQITYLAVLSNNNICALDKEGNVKLISTTGKRIKTFKPELPSVPTTLALDEKDQIYLMYPIQENIKQKVRGRTIERMETKSYECAIFNTKGEKLKIYPLAGMEAATGARIINDKLLVADYKNRVISVFNKENGTKETDIEGMRPCCRILDFSVNEKDEILVANLGAFRVQAYDLTGKQILAFGKRGKSIDDFHGCCNPVSVAYLSNGAIVTVEKDPTRIKVYSSEGAKQISGIEELVEGCSYIPMIVDGNDNLYLASPKKGIIKCVSI